MKTKYVSLLLSLLCAVSLSWRSLAEELKVYTLGEVAQHRTAADCWMIIEGRVYDVTSYVPKHPKKYPLQDVCGQDVSEGWKTKGEKQKPHSRKAHAFLEKMLIGRLAPA